MSNDALVIQAQVQRGWEWRKASFSAVDNCVEVAALGRQRVGIRDSKNPRGPMLVLEAGEFASWLAAIKEGQFDDFGS